MISHREPLPPTDIHSPQSTSAASNEAVRPFDFLRHVLVGDSPGAEGACPLLTELDAYITFAEAPCETVILIRWKANAPSFLVLAKLTRIVMLISATSATSGRVFSYMSDVVDEKRNRIDSKTTEKLIFLQLAIPAMKEGVLKSICGIKLKFFYSRHFLLFRTGCTAVSSVRNRLEYFGTDITLHCKQEIR